MEILASLLLKSNQNTVTNFRIKPCFAVIWFDLRSSGFLLNIFCILNIIRTKVIQPWWLGGRASASLSVEVGVQTLIKCYLGGSNPALGMLYQSTSGRNTMSHIHMNAGCRVSSEVYDDPIRDDSIYCVNSLIIHLAYFIINLYYSNLWYFT